MLSRLSLIALFGILLLAGISMAAEPCASKPFKDACNACTFDANGKMNEQCWKGYEDSGKTCLAVAYPGMTFAYQFGSGCKQLDECVSRLTACKEAMKSGSDKTDCNNPAMHYCFTMADNCALAANKVCSEGKTEEEAGFDDEEAGGPKKNDTKGEKTDAEIEMEMEDDPFIQAFCGEPAAIMMFLMMGTLFYRMKR